MLKINDGYNTIKLEIKHYESKQYRKNNKIDEDDSWTTLNIELENEYVKIENFYYGLESLEVDMMYELLNEFVNDKMDDNYIFEPLEPSFKIYFYPYGKEYKDSRYVQENISKNDKEISIFIAFIEKDNQSISDDGVIVNISLEETKEILKYLESIIKDDQ